MSEDRFMTGASKEIEAICKALGIDLDKGVVVGLDLSVYSDLPAKLTVHTLVRDELWQAAGGCII